MAVPSSSRKYKALNSKILSFVTSDIASLTDLRGKSQGPKSFLPSLFGKALSKEMCWGTLSPNGKLLDERLKAIEAAWCVDLQKNFPSSDLNLAPKEEPEEKDECLERTVAASQVGPAS